MKQFRTVKAGVEFVLDYDETVRIIKARQPLAAEFLDDKKCCTYLDGLDACDLWDFYESAIMYTHSTNEPTMIIGD